MPLHCVPSTEVSSLAVGGEAYNARATHALQRLWRPRKAIVTQWLFGNLLTFEWHDLEHARQHSAVVQRIVPVASVMIIHSPKFISRAHRWHHTHSIVGIFQWLAMADWTALLCTEEAACCHVFLFPLIILYCCMLSTLPSLWDTDGY